MKYPICVILILLLLSTSCKKDNLSLPSETQTGANTFGCKVDGKVWVPTGTDVYSGQNVIAKYMFYEGRQILTISANDYNGSRSFFVIGSDSIKLYTGLKLKITNNKGFAGGRYVTHDENYNSINYYASDLLGGEMSILLLDEMRQIVSGTFWFDGINNNGEKIKITEGRFDVKYTR